MDRRRHIRMHLSHDVCRVAGRLRRGARSSERGDADETLGVRSVAGGGTRGKGMGSSVVVRLGSEASHRGARHVPKQQAANSKGGLEGSERNYVWHS